MAELNEAYAQIRSADRRAVYDRIGQPVSAIRPGKAEPPSTPARARRESAHHGILNFGRCVGWSVADLARHDRDYLKWLSRHSSGFCYRGAIDETIRSVQRAPTASQRTRGR